MDATAQPSWVENAKIYHVFLDRFAGWKQNYSLTELRKGFLYGNINELINKLEYIKNLGFNAIWLSPFYVNQPYGYHGYHIINYNHVDPRFAFGENPHATEIGNPLDEQDFNFTTAADLCLQKFIELAHEMNIKIIADFVPNHCHEKHPFFQKAKKDSGSKYAKWFNFKENPLKKTITTYDCFLSVGELPKLNLENEECEAYMIQVARHWLLFGVDGFRIDHCIGPSKRFLKTFSQTLKKEFPSVVIIGECLPLFIGENEYSTILGLDKADLESITGKVLLPSHIAALDNIFLQYEGIIDGLLDFSYMLILDFFVSGKISEKDMITMLTQHYQRFNDKNLILPKLLDSHDNDRILFRCHDNFYIFQKALAYLFESSEKYGRKFKDPLVFYYGTEDYMTQTRTIFGEPYGDFRARQPMQFKFQFISNIFLSK